MNGSPRRHANAAVPRLRRTSGGGAAPCVDFAAAAKLGVRTGLADGSQEGGSTSRYDVLDYFAMLAAQGRFTVPIARTFALTDWREALDIGLTGRAHGKLMIVP